MSISDQHPCIRGLREKGCLLAQREIGLAPLKPNGCQNRTFEGLNVCLNSKISVRICCEFADGPEVSRVREAKVLYYANGVFSVCRNHAKA